MPVLFCCHDLYFFNNTPWQFLFINYSTTIYNTNICSLTFINYNGSLIIQNIFIYHYITFFSSLYTFIWSKIFSQYNVFWRLNYSFHPKYLCFIHHVHSAFCQWILNHLIQNIFIIGRILAVRLNPLCAM